ncbi:2Fe-2S iron-sulfur cluster-binding protein [Chloroflexota bacterium]
MNSDTVKLNIARYDPEKDRKYTQTYEVPRGTKIRVLDFLNYIFDELDPSLAYRRHLCNAKMCNGCIMDVDDKPRMVCWEVVPPEKTAIALAPQKGKKVLKDLVVDFGAGVGEEQVDD